MKQGRLRTMSICLTDIEQISPEKITVAGNGKRYVSLTTWDYDESAKTDHDFSISITRTSQEKAEGKSIHWIGGGIIHEVK